MAGPTADNIYGYNGSTVAAAIFSALYGGVLSYHGYLCLCRPFSVCYKHRYTIPLFFGAMLLVAGYSIRAASVNNPSNVALYATSSSYIVIGPIFVCATMYWLLAYLVRLSLPKGPEQKLCGVSPVWLGRIFITSDVLSFMTQGAGSGVASGGNWEGNTGQIGVDILLGGLALQLATFTVYIAFVAMFVGRVRGLPEVSFPAGVGKVLNGIWIAAGFVQARTIYRLVEFLLGIDGYPFQHEWCLYIFEGVPTLVALTALAWWHPVKLLQTKRFFDEGCVDNDKYPRCRELAGA